jgi:hypothetical protein
MIKENREAYEELANRITWLLEAIDEIARTGNKRRLESKTDSVSRLLQYVYLQEVVITSLTNYYDSAQRTQGHQGGHQGADPSRSII